MTDTTAFTGFGAEMVTAGAAAYPDPLEPRVTMEVVTAPAVGAEIVAVAWVVPAAEAITPYCLQLPAPGVPRTPPVTAGLEQYFPRLEATTDPSSIPTMLAWALATAVL